MCITIYENIFWFIITCDIEFEPHNDSFKFNFVMRRRVPFAPPP
jgi:hypothetical protein